MKKEPDYVWGTDEEKDKEEIRRAVGSSPAGNRSCTKCGRQSPEGSVFCNHCGEPFISGRLRGGRSKSPLGKYGLISIVFGVLVLVLIIVVISMPKTSSSGSYSGTGYIKVNNYTNFGFELLIDGRSQGWLKSGDTFNNYEGYKGGTTVYVIGRNEQIGFYKRWEVKIEKGETLECTARY